MAMCAFSTSYSNSSALSRIDPSYNTPNALGTISVYVKKIGNVSYYVAKRYLGLVSDNVLQYTSPTAISIATNPTFTTTGLTANTKYTFVFVATDVNGYSASGTAATPKGGNGDGSIYTLAPPSPSTLTLTYNGGGSSLTTVSFTYSFTTVSSNNTGLSIRDYNGNFLQTVPVAASGSGQYTSTSTIAGSTTNKNTLYTYNVYVLNAAGVGDNISVCNQTIQTCTWADISAASFVLPDTLNRIYNSVSNSSFTNFIGTATSCTFSRSGGTQAGFTSAVQSINNCIDFSYCSANTQYTYYLTPYNLLNYGAETIQCKSIINQARPTVTTLYGKIYSLWDPSSITMTYNGGASSLTIVSFGYVTTSGYTASIINLYDYAVNLVTSSTSTSTIAGVATTPNTIYRYYGIGRNIDQYFSTNIIACAAYVDTCTWANITYAEFAPLDTANRIYNSSLNASIVGITGNYTSFTFGRSWFVGQYTYTNYDTTLQTGTMCIDMSTNLNANTQYQYQLYPYNKLGYGMTSWSTTISNTRFTTITNKNRYVYSYPVLTLTPTTTGYIYTLADPSGIIIKPNTVKIYNNIQFSIISTMTIYMSWNNRPRVRLEYGITTGIDLYVGATTYATTSDSYSGISSKRWTDNLIPNTIYLFKFDILNSDGVGLDIPACSYEINLCSMADITGIPTFCYPDTIGAIYNSSTKSTITDITGNYKYYIVTRKGGYTSANSSTSFNGGQTTVGAQITYVSEKQTNSTFVDSTTNLLSNIYYIYSIDVYNKNDASFNFTSIINRLYSTTTTNNGKIYTLPDPSGVTITGNTSALNPVFSITFNFIRNNPNSYPSVGNVCLLDSNNNSLGSKAAYSLVQTFSPTTYNGAAITYNTLYTFTFNVYNSENINFTSPVTNIPISLTITICTPARSSSYGNFYSPDTLNTLKNSANNATIYGLNYQCAYYIVERKNMTSNEIVKTKVTTDGAYMNSTGTYSDLSTNLPSNTQYQYTITYYNQIDVSSIAYSGFINPKSGLTRGKIYTLADPLSCIVTDSSCTYVSQLLRKPITWGLVNTGAKQVYFYTWATSSGTYTNQSRLGPLTTQTSITINVASGTTRPAIPAGAAITLMVDNGDYYGNTLAACMRAIPFSS